MDFLEPSANDQSMEATTTSEDVLVVLQTESGEQIALPMSALPSDFVPGDSGQIIMVGSALDEQHQEVVVESSDLNEHHEINENLVSNQVGDGNADSNLPSNAIINHESSTIIPAASLSHPDVVQFQSSSSGDKQVPRTYSKNSIVKSYAPTCATTTRIYQQPQTENHIIQPSDQANQDASNLNQIDEQEIRAMIEKLGNEPREIESKVQNESMTIPDDQVDALPTKPTVSTANHPEAPVTPRKKQKRKETLQTKPLNEEDKELEFQIIEVPSPIMQEEISAIKRKPRKEYRTKKKVRLAMERLSKEELADVARDMESRESDVRGKRQLEKVSKKNEIKEESRKEEPMRDELKKTSPAKELKRETPKREMPKRGTRTRLNELSPKSQPPQITPQPQSDRRTRLSNTCRVATGKSYKCNDCDFSTDRINNIIIHVRESCPKLKRI